MNKYVACLTREGHDDAFFYEKVNFQGKIIDIRN